MKRNTSIRLGLLATLFALGLTACASNPSNALVIPRENNQFDTVGLGKSKVAALNVAMQNVNSACRGKGSPVVVNEQTKYNGVINEDTGRIIEQVGAAVGAIAGVKAPGIARDDDYEVTLRFYCR